MEAKAVYDRVARQWPEDAAEFKGDVFDPSFHVTPKAVVEVCRFLRDDPELKFEVLSDLTAVDRPKENKLEIVYHLYSYALRHQIVLKVDVPRDDSHAPTMEGVWKAANWFEREVFDLFGIIFDSHSDLRRIMLPEDWVGHPLRKDYVEQEEYDGISTNREPLVRNLLR
jgi:NADH-quinone oxidoreductase subunit C